MAAVIVTQSTSILTDNSGRSCSELRCLFRLLKYKSNVRTCGHKQETLYVHLTIAYR